MIEIKNKKFISDGSIEGFVNGQSVIRLSAINGKYHVGMSCALPVDLKLAAEYVECYQMAINKAKMEGFLNND